VSSRAKPAPACHARPACSPRHDTPVGEDPAEPAERNRVIWTVSLTSASCGLTRQRPSREPRGGGTGAPVLPAQAPAVAVVPRKLAVLQQAAPGRRLNHRPRLPTTTRPHRAGGGPALHGRDALDRRDAGGAWLSQPELGRRIGLRPQGNRPRRTRSLRYALEGGAGAAGVREPAKAVRSERSGFFGPVERLSRAVKTASTRSSSG
jgi:hypothetical protein